MHDNKNENLFFSPNDIKDLTETYSKISRQYEKVLLKYTSLEFKNTETVEYARQGFVRRIIILRRCIENIWNIYPLSKSEKPTRDDVSDLMINLQSFMFNIFGCIENLAWVWVKENNFLYKKNTDVKFTNPAIRSRLSANFISHLEKRKEWLCYLTDYRHTLAHRIPLYVPLFALTETEGNKFKELEETKIKALKQFNIEEYDRLEEEQSKLGRFRPWMTRSLGENDGPIWFHPQVLADWEKIIEFSEEFLKELKL